MNHQAQQYIAQGVIQHLDGNMELFQRYIKQAMILYDRDAHLFVTVSEILKSKGRNRNFSIVRHYVGNKTL